MDAATYRSRITLKASTASLWQADMLFGHFCWWHVHAYGQQSLEDLLDEYRQGKPRFILSDGFPKDHFPRLKRMRVSRPASTRLKRIEEAPKRKDLKKIEWLYRDDFERVRRGEEFVCENIEEYRARLRVHSERDSLAQYEALDATWGDLDIRAMNQIDRRTNTAGSAGGDLFDFDSRLVRKVDIYWKIRSDAYGDVLQFLDDLKKSGYGKRKAVGYGAIADCQLDAFSFPEVENANAYALLSRCVPAEKNSTDGCWDIAVKYGKIGEDLAERVAAELNARAGKTAEDPDRHRGQPFKCPLIQIEAGSVFKGTTPAFCGRLVDGVVAFADPKVAHYGFGFPVALYLPDDDSADADSPHAEDSDVPNGMPRGS